MMMDMVVFRNKNSNASSSDNTITNIIMSMNKNMIMNSAIYTCANQYGILEMILSGLGATDAASFIHALEIDISPRIANKYVCIMRDMPEHLDWIMEQDKLGHSVVLIGADLMRLWRRIMNPWSYDRRNEKPLCIWLAVVPSLEFRRKIAEGQLMTWKGGLLNMGDFEVLNGVMNPLPVGPGWTSSPCRLSDGTFSYVENALTSAFICRFEHMRPLPSTSTYDKWFISTIPNENNINVLFYASYDAESKGLTAIIEPCAGMNLQAIACREMLTGERIRGREDEWNVPLIRRCGDETTEIMTLRYDAALGVEVVRESTHGMNTNPLSRLDTSLDAIMLHTRTMTSIMVPPLTGGAMDSAVPAMRRNTLMMPVGIVRKPRLINT